MNRGQSMLYTATLSSQNDAVMKVNLPGLWDWLMKSAPKGFILKKRLQEYFYLFAYGVNDLLYL